MSEEVPSTQKAEALDENSSFTASSVQLDLNQQQVFSRRALQLYQAQNGTFGARRASTAQRTRTDSAENRVLKFNDHSLELDYRSVRKRVPLATVVTGGHFGEEEALETGGSCVRQTMAVVRSRQARILRIAVNDLRRLLKKKQLTPEIYFAEYANKFLDKRIAARQQGLQKTITVAQTYEDFQKNLENEAKNTKAQQGALTLRLLRMAQP